MKRLMPVLGLMVAIAIIIVSSLFTGVQPVSAHHNDIVVNYTCDSYSVTMNYYGGSGERTAFVYRAGQFAGRFYFQAGTQQSLGFYTDAGTLPADVTYEVYLYVGSPATKPTTGSADYDRARVNRQASCTPTPTATPTNFVPGNPTCPVGFMEFKLEPPQSGVYVFNGVTLVVTIAQPPTKVSFTADPGVIWKVIVKAGNGALVYDFPGGTSGALDLVSPTNASGGPADISHVSFCYVIPTATPTATSTATSTATATFTVTPTDTATNTPTVTNTPTDTATNTPTVTATATDTATNTPTVTNTPTDTATNTPTVTATATNTATNTPTVTNTPTDTATNTPTVTNTPTDTATNTPTVTATPTDTATNTPTVTSTPTDTATNTPTVTATPTDTATNTPTVTNTPTDTATNTPENTATPTATATATSTDVPSATPTATSTQETVTPTPTNTPGETVTPTPVHTLTDEPSPLAHCAFFSTKKGMAYTAYDAATNPLSFSGTVSEDGRVSFYADPADLPVGTTVVLVFADGSIYSFVFSPGGGDDLYANCRIEREIVSLPTPTPVPVCVNCGPAVREIPPDDGVALVHYVVARCAEDLCNPNMLDEYVRAKGSTREFALQLMNGDLVQSIPVTVGETTVYAAPFDIPTHLFNEVVNPDGTPFDGPVWTYFACSDFPTLASLRNMNGVLTAQYVPASTVYDWTEFFVQTFDVGHGEAEDFARLMSFNSTMAVPIPWDLR